MTNLTPLAIELTPYQKETLAMLKTSEYYVSYSIEETLLVVKMLKWWSLYSNPYGLYAWQGAGDTIDGDNVGGYLVYRDPCES